MPNMAAAEYKYLVPLIGTDLYTDLQTKFTANTLSLIETTLLGYIRSMTVAAAYMDEVARDVVKFNDNGLQRNVVPEQRIYGWEYKEAKQGITDLYFDNMEILLRWLYDNKSSFALWTDSDEYKAYDALLIKNGTDFNKQYQLYQPMRNYWQLRGIVQDVQDNYHSLALGSGLLTYFVNLTSPTDAEKDILRSLKKAMAFFTIYRACRMHSVRFSSSGFTIASSEVEAESSSQTASSLTQLQMHMNAAEQDGYQQLERAKKLAKSLRAAVSGKGAGYDAAFDAGPLVGYTAASITERNNALTSGVRLGI